MDDLREFADERPMVALRGKTGCRLPHFHEPIELLYVTAGHISVTINGETVRASRGALCVSGCYDVHAYAPESDGEGLLFTFPAEILQKFFARTKGQAVTRHFFSDAAIARTVESYAALVESGKAYDELFYEGWANVLFGMLFDSLALTEGENGTLATVRSILTYIRTHANETLSLEELSARFGYSKYHFSYLFHKYTNLNLCKFVNAVRLEKVTERLRQGDDVRLACKDVGFKSERTFYRSFTQTYGTTPQKYAAAVTAKEE